METVIFRERYLSAERGRERRVRVAAAVVEVNVVRIQIDILFPLLSSPSSPSRFKARLARVSHRTEQRRKKKKLLGKEIFSSDEMIRNAQDLKNVKKGFSSFCCCLSAGKSNLLCCSQSSLDVFRFFLLLLPPTLQVRREKILLRLFKEKEEWRDVFRH